MHINEDEAAIPGLAGHEIDERLNGASLEVGFSVGVRVMANSMADAPDDVAKATQVKDTGPHVVVAVEKVVAEGRVILVQIYCNVRVV